MSVGLIGRSSDFDGALATKCIYINSITVTLLTLCLREVEHHVPVEGILSS